MASSRVIASIHARDNQAHALYKEQRSKSKKSNMPNYEEFALGPLEKWRKQKKFPYKLFFHLCMLLLVSANTIIVAYQKVQFYQSSESFFVNLFLPSDYEAPVNTSNGKNTAMIFTVDGFVAYLTQVVQTFYNLTSISADKIIWVSPSNHILDQPHPPKLSITKFQSFKADLGAVSNYDPRATVTETHDLTPDNPIGPFSGSTQLVQDHLSKIESMSLQLYLGTIDVNPVVPKCVWWEVNLLFPWQNRGGALPVQMIYNSGPCHGVRLPDWSSLTHAPTFWLNIFIIALAICTEILVMRAMLKSCRLVGTAKRTVREKIMMKIAHSQPLSGSSSVISGSIHTAAATLHSQRQTLFERIFGISFASAKDFFNLWLIWNFLTSIMCIVSSSMQLSALTFTSFERKFIDLFLGLNVLMVWVNIIRYIEHSPKFYVLILALNKAIPNVARFVFGALPILIGYALAGNLLFGPRSTWFQTPAESLLTLFSLLNGDSMHETFDVTFGPTRFLAIVSTCYMYTFICLFIYAVLNIFIMIVGEAYGNVKEAEYLQQKQKKLRELFGRPSTRSPAHSAPGSRKASNAGSRSASPSIIAPYVPPAVPGGTLATNTTTSNNHNSLQLPTITVTQPATLTVPEPSPPVATLLEDPQQHKQQQSKKPRVFHHSRERSRHGFRTMRSLLRLNKQEYDRENEEMEMNSVSGFGRGVFQSDGYQKFEDGPMHDSDASEDSLEGEGIEFSDDSETEHPGLPAPAQIQLNQIKFIAAGLYDTLKRSQYNVVTAHQFRLVTQIEEHARVLVHDCKSAHKQQFSPPLSVTSE